MKKEDDSRLDAHFPIRTYGKGELAMCYIRGVCQHTAVKQFNEWYAQLRDWNNVCWPRV